MSTAVIYLDELKIASPELQTISVRIIRKWQDYFVKTGKKWGFGYIFADEKGNFAYAKLMPTHEKKLKYKLIEQGVYEIDCFSVHERTKSFNPVRENCIITFEENTEVKPIKKDVFSIPTTMPFQFVEFRDIQTQPSNDYLIDVIGFIASCTPVIASGGKNKKFIVLQDEKDATLKITIWEEQFHLFDENKVQENCVLVLTSLLPSTYKGVISLSTKPSTLFFYDLNIPEVQSLKDSGVHINMERVESENVQMVNWQNSQRVTLDEMIRQYRTQMEKTSFVCECKITTFWKAWSFLACEKCFRGVEENVSGKSFCENCNAVTNSFQAYNAVVNLADDSRSCEATIWTSVLEKFFQLDVRDIANLALMRLDVNPIFRVKLDRSGIFQISMSTFKNTMSLSVTKYVASTEIVPHGDGALLANHILEDANSNLLQVSTMEEVYTPAKKDTSTSKKRKVYEEGNELSADSDDGDDGAVHEDVNESLDDADREVGNQSIQAA